ncbi:hypothetical protein CHIBA101_1834 [Actinomyces sp. Chiba101]|uniref:hypothetical protein n=1 Tax=Actinomyces TaxID=1654 RepID=UPI000974DBF6|nr:MULTISPECIES: hypothetical protein [Actinomyces]BAW93667.1 hypothetical protein CHIBA101_1834 [Actinomyces sp. Chiba101]GAV93482.1 hypothetical protein ADENT20671_0226 [Actinomyces denticolens]SUU74622.1 Uncharacterised protein [Actinomyces denticolens]
MSKLPRLAAGGAAAVLSLGLMAAPNAAAEGAGGASDATNTSNGASSTINDPSIADDPGKQGADDPKNATPTITASAPSVEVGKAITITVAGLPPAAASEVIANPGGIALGTVTPDSKGAGTVDWTVGKEVKPGDYTISLKDNPKAGARIIVTAPKTGADAANPGSSSKDAVPGGAPSAAPSTSATPSASSAPSATPAATATQAAPSTAAVSSAPAASAAATPSATADTAPSITAGAGAPADSAASQSASLARTGASTVLGVLAVGLVTAGIVLRAASRRA